MPEFADATPRTLYVSRPVKNGAEIIAWARAQGFASLLDAEDLHVTVAYSRKPVDWFDLPTWGADEDIEIKGGPRVVEPLGNEGAVVLKIASDRLKHRHSEILAKGASWDWPEYQPHVTLSYDAADVDLSGIEAYQGDVVLGPERFSEIETDWAARYKTDSAGPAVLFDAAPLTGVRRTNDGYLIADARVARTGIQEYRGAEVGRPDRDVVRVYRPAQEVTDADTLRSYAYRPITMGHPSKPVSAENWKDLAVGQTGGDVGEETVGDVKYIRVPMAIMDSAAISEIEAGSRQISMGYTAMLDWTDGVTPDGQRYDAIQRRMKMNHLAVVSAARGGPALKIGDTIEEGGPNMPDNRQVVVDGLTFAVSDQAAQVIEKLQKQIADAETKAEEARKAHDEAMGKKDAEIDDLKKKVVDEAELDRLADARAEIIGKAKIVAKDVKTEGLSNADIRREVVKSRLGDAYSKDWSDEYVGARFDALTADVKSPDPVLRALDGAKSEPHPMSDEAVTARLKRAGIKVKEA